MAVLVLFVFASVKEKVQSTRLFGVPLTIVCFGCLKYLALVIVCLGPANVNTVLCCLVLLTVSVCTGLLCYSCSVSAD